MGRCCSMAGSSLQRARLCLVLREGHILDTAVAPEEGSISMRQALACVWMQSYIALRPPLSPTSSYTPVYHRHTYHDMDIPVQSNRYYAYPISSGYSIRISRLGAAGGLHESHAAVGNRYMLRLHLNESRAPLEVRSCRAIQQQQSFML